MQEDFLQFIWKHQYFNRESLKTTNDEDVNIFNQGIHNFDAGPDFIEGMLTVGELTWTGHIEIHRRSSEWKQHQATETEGDQVLEGVEGSARIEAEQIHATLQRIEAGSYGECMTCGETIGEQRLEALPYALQCITCARG